MSVRTTGTRQWVTKYLQNITEKLIDACSKYRHLKGSMPTHERGDAFRRKKLTINDKVKANTHVYYNLIKN